MRFRSLRLRAFGPFTGHTLDLAGGAPGGLHLIFGPNEAGKSTALRAVHDLLFGIPERTQDAYLHPTSELRLGAVLEAPDGVEIELFRIKKRKDSLRDARDAPLDEAVLGRLLGGVDASLFERLFGLNHERLQQAGENLLAGKGDVGESLFDAAGGGRGIRQVLEDLERRAGELFKPRGKAKLNALLDRYADAKRQARDATRPADKYLEQRAAVERAERERERLGAERRNFREEEHRLKRIRANLPGIAEREAHLQKLAALGEVRGVPERCGERRSAAEQSLLATRAEIERCQREIERREKRRSSLDVPEGLLELSAEDIQELRDGVGQTRAARRDQPKLLARIRTGEDDAIAILRRLGYEGSLDEAERLRLGSVELGRIRRLGEQRAILLERRTLAEKLVAELERDMARARQKAAQLPAERDTKRLEAALRKARGAGDIEQRLEERKAALDALIARAEERSAALGLWQGELSALTRLAVPALEAVAGFETEFQAIAERKRATTDEARRLRDQAADVERRIRALQAAGEVPNEADLAQSRARRQQGLSHLLEAWRAGAPPEVVTPQFDPERPLAEAFERAVAQVDELGDRLRREASRVSELAALLAEQSHVELLSGRAAADGQAIEREEADAEERWHALWLPAGVGPLRPRAMQAWLRNQRELVALAEQIDQESRAVEQLLRERAAVRTALERALALESEAAVEQELLAMSLAVEEELAESKSRAERSRELEELLHSLESKSEQARGELDEHLRSLELWNAQWSEAMQPLGFRTEVAPEEASLVVDELGEFRSKLDEVKGAKKREQGIERDAAAFSERVKGHVGSYAPDLLGTPADAAAEQLAKRYDQARHDAEERTRIDRELAELGRELEGLEVQKLAADRELSELFRAAGAESSAELADLESRAAEASRLKAALERMEAQLRETGEGLELDALLDEARGVERASLAARIDELKELHERSDEEIVAADRQVTSLEAGLAHYSERDAADSAQEVEELAAEIRHHATEYARVKLSFATLRREVERYRERNQGPVLKRAQALFERLTLSRYKALRVGVEESVLVCVLADGKEVGVSELSEGTRYQLYLALRLASLERYLERNPALPLVLDDVFMTFDDDRVAAAFKVLADVAQRMQILFFTHHARHIEIAKSALPAGGLFEHELPIRSVQPDVVQQSLF